MEVEISNEIEREKNKISQGRKRQNSRYGNNKNEKSKKYH